MGIGYSEGCCIVAVILKTMAEYSHVLGDVQYSGDTMIYVEGYSEYSGGSSEQWGVIMRTLSTVSYYENNEYREYSKGIHDYRGWIF